MLTHLSLEELAGVSVRRRYGSIPELLALRQQGGRNRVRGKHGKYQYDSRSLSSAVAWNPSRLQNMILAVGPGTPAAALLDSPNLEDSSSSSSTSSVVEEDMDDDDDDDEEEEPQQLQFEIEEQENNDDSEEEDEDNDEERQEEPQAERQGVLEALEDVSPELARAMWYLRRQLEEAEGSSDAESEDHDEHIPSLRAGKFVSSMRHGGCINTAAWNTSPWRLSLAGYPLDDSEPSACAVDCQEYSTQLLTSGDDRVVKFWDVRHAMGTSNPLPGGRYVQTPFADESKSQPCNWKTFASQDAPAGSVIPLATINTGHRNNVFHATTLDHHPGKVATCGADGYLRISDLNTSNGASTVVVSPERDQDDSENLLPAGLLSLRSSMCFSHHFLDANCGLLCSEHGLRHFDIRLSPREQRSGSLLGDNKMCKSCAIWSASGTLSKDVESAYVFAGGQSSEVILFDLRMTDSDSRKVVQRYQPQGIDRCDSVSVSGLDISRDRRELLVSYENDQIYTFPIFPQAASAAGPTLDEIIECSKNSEQNSSRRLPELASYGGHLNRYTFLKNAKYAGPNDEYICTGSDSGHAWIYERATGAVSSLLFADRSTCNGVVPHPSLPFFITYGIESTAKLWRATNPVDGCADDSPLGRARHYHQQEYEKSAIVKNYGYVAMSLALDCEDEEVGGIFPDQLPAGNGNLGPFSMGGIIIHRRGLRVDGGDDYSIGNNLRNLPAVLQKNFYECARAERKGDDKPIQSPISELATRVASIRLKHQADQRGLLWDSSIPWKLCPRETYRGLALIESTEAKSEETQAEEYGNSVNLVPNFPSDWIPFDPYMIRDAFPCGMHFDLGEYADFYLENYDHIQDNKESQAAQPSTHPWLPPSACTLSLRPKSIETEDDGEAKDAESASSYNADHALKILYETASLLKNDGNTALEAGCVMEAARRYDRAIVYCSTALMDCPATSDLYEKSHHKWTPLRKLLVVTRLNLCMVLNKIDAKGAGAQAELALQEVSPFSTQKGKVFMGRRLESVYKEDEPEQTYLEAKELQAKARFRLGCVHMKTKCFEEAIESFEESIDCTKELSKPPDPVVLRRLAEAKREHARKSKRQRKKFKRMFEESS